MNAQRAASAWIGRYILSHCRHACATGVRLCDCSERCQRWVSVVVIVSTSHHLAAQSTLSTLGTAFGSAAMTGLGFAAAGVDFTSGGLCRRA
mmetsp:Transcript_60496/g.144150  ORF Transcript_60496/g.144150 Transcript_60496/m.144150 type:complete len:92 (+) Transcript_60496:89-364(+)